MRGICVNIYAVYTHGEKSACKATSIDRSLKEELRVLESEQIAVSLTQSLLSPKVSYTGH